MMHSFILSIIASIVVGLFTTTLWSYSYTLLQKNIEEKYYGRVVAYNDMLFLTSAAFTSFITGFLSSHNYSLEYITSILGLGFIIGAIYFVWISRSFKFKS
jgi:predicted MFS family arabinose efflux permease